MLRLSINAQRQQSEWELRVLVMDCMSHCLAIMSRLLETHTFSNADFTEHISKDCRIISGDVSADT